MKLSKIIISAGHGTKAGADQGAEGFGTTEGKFVAAFRADLVIELNKELAAVSTAVLSTKPIVVTDPDAYALKETLAYLKGKTDADSLCIDLHLNSTDKQTVKGTEVLVPFDASAVEVEIADKLSDIIGEVLGTPERGNFKGKDGVRSEDESQHSRLGWMRIAGHNILIELDFISNPDAMTILKSKQKTLCQRFAQYVVGLLKK